MAVVKANAYGHGATKCALRLESEGVDWFGVALPEEGVEIRQGGVTRPILCLGSFWQGQESSLIDNDLTPVIYDLHTGQSLDRFAKDRDIEINIHVKIDTGMGRVGIGHRNVAYFAEGLKQSNSLKVTGLMTHFAAAENPDESEFTRLQIDRFEQACDVFRSAGHEPELIDLANSPGAITHPESRGNMVRIGGALFGLLDDILPSGIPGPELKEVLSLRSQIAYLRNVPAGESLGYGRIFYTKRDSIIALVPLGYADGYPRRLSNCGSAIAGGQMVPLVGRMSMDWTLFDVTDVPELSVGDEIVLIGDGQQAADIAKLVGTIAYEITCGLSPRVPRIYE